MYHELTPETKRKRIRNRVLALVSVMVLIAVCWAASTQIAANFRAQGELSIRNAILNSAKQCCAIEGSYPSSLRYLEDNYGLTINHSNYTITYEIFAENVMPSVVVLTK